MRQPNWKSNTVLLCAVLLALALGTLLYQFDITSAHDDIMDGPPMTGEEQSVTDTDNAIRGPWTVPGLASRGIAALAAAALLLRGLGDRSLLGGSVRLTCLLQAGYLAFFSAHVLAGGNGRLGPENLCVGVIFMLLLLLQGRLRSDPAPVVWGVAASIAGVCLYTALSAATAPAILHTAAQLFPYIQYASILYLLAMSAIAATKQIWYTLIPLACTVVFMAVSFFVNRMHPWTDAPLLLSRWGGAVLAAALGGAVCMFTVSAVRETAGLRERLALANRQLVLQRDRVLAMEEDIAETRRVRHDLRHHLSVLQDLLHADLDRAQAYLWQLTAAIPRPGERLCQNLAADCLIGKYVAAARTEGVKVETSLDLPQDAGVADVDLCVVLGNLLENALEALQREEPGGKLLRISAGTTGKVLAINIDNTSSRQLCFREGRLFSSKQDRSGVGLTSVRAVAHRYRGEFWWRSEDGMFRASIVLKAEEQVS